VCLILREHHLFWVKELPSPAGLRVVSIDELCCQLTEFPVCSALEIQRKVGSGWLGYVRGVVWTQGAMIHVTHLHQVDLELMAGKVLYHGGMVAH
jgi:hypothetical protein